MFERTIGIVAPLTQIGISDTHAAELGRACFVAAFDSLIEFRFRHDIEFWVDRWVEFAFVFDGGGGGASHGQAFSVGSE